MVKHIQSVHTLQNNLFILNVQSLNHISDRFSFSLVGRLVGLNILNIYSTSRCEAFIFSKHTMYTRVEIVFPNIIQKVFFKYTISNCEVLLVMYTYVRIYISPPDQTHALMLMLLTIIPSAYQFLNMNFAIKLQSFQAPQANKVVP